jgi:hypothetical protein
MRGRNEHRGNRANHRHQRPRRRRRDCGAISAAGCTIELLEARRLLATFTVNDSGDASDYDLTDGICDTDEDAGGLQVTLRAAIENANLEANKDTINFSLNYLSPQSSLPALYYPVIIDGGPSAASGVEINGGWGLGNGLVIFGGDSTVRNLIITGFSLNGIVLQGTGGNVVQGCYLGIGRDGDTSFGNGFAGLQILSCPDNTIGGASPLLRNVISGNNVYGIHVTGPASTNNTIIGNHIGTSADGDAAVPNTYSGVQIESPDNVVGGTTATARNVISGNGLVAGPGRNGVHLRGIHAKRNKILGNYIGVAADGMTPLRNMRSGVVANDGATENVIGGDQTGAGNVICANVESGVYLQHSNTARNVVQGNSIGVTPVSQSGGDLGNLFEGVTIDDSPDNTIGGAGVARNVISDNEYPGVEITGAAATGNKILGNYIGIDASGNAARGNGQAGVLVRSANNFVGGTTAGEGNVISGNNFAGIDVVGSAASGNTIQGNFIGTNALGTGDLGNANNGIHVNGSPNTTIGGSVIGARNVISGNDYAGIEVGGITATNTTIQGNYIGTNAEGTARVPNTLNGVLIYSSENTIGGTTALMRNVISGNGLIPAIGRNGVQLEGPNARNNRVHGNYIGVAANGTTPLGNMRSGVAINDGASQNIIGGTQNLTGNVISANTESGVYIQHGNSTQNVVARNYIGLKFNGTGVAGNGYDGVTIDGSPNNTIGGLTSAEGNVISGNVNQGVRILGVAASSNTLENNFIGTNKDGNVAAPNQQDGVLIDGAPNNIIGGFDEVARNVICANLEGGIRLLGAADHNRIQANHIGIGVGDVPLGNGTFGIDVRGGVLNEIGGPDEGNGNTVAHNGFQATPAVRGHGIIIQSGTRNAIRRNSVFDNAGRGIDLGDDSFTVNDLRDVDTGSNDLQDYPVVTEVTFPVGAKTIEWTLNSTSETTYTIDFFSNDDPDPGGFGEGKTYLRSRVVTTNVRGNAIFTESFASDELFISCTATDPAGNTSEFSMVDSDGDAVPDGWETNGIDFNEDGTIDLSLGSADPEHKDLFVEVDAMTSRSPGVALLDVELQFLAAPNSAVHNPDGTPGIVLHVSEDETNIPVPTTAWTDGTFIEFDPVKTAHFGTAAERANANAIAAKRLVYRYCIFADEQGTGTTLGLAELPEIDPLSDPHGRNDFFLTMGAPGTWSPTENAAGFMHELGHTLGLHHGGQDNVNFKPNYHSVMNYMWWRARHATEGPPGPLFTQHINSWELTYSDRAFNDLNENALSEAVGINGHPGHITRSTNRPIVNQFLVPERGPLDWDGDLILNETVVRDINRDGVFQMLRAFEDWSRLRYYFGENLETADGFHYLAEDAEPEPTTGQNYVTVEDISVDEPNSGTSDAVFTIALDEPADGPVTVHYRLLPGTAIAPDDYTSVSGDVNFEFGQTTQTIRVSIVGDSIAEPDETFTLLLSAGPGAQLINWKATCTINDPAPGSPPVIAPIGNRDVNEGGSLQFTVVAHDDDGDALIFSLVGNVPAGATIDPVTGAFSFTPASSADDGASFDVTVRVTDQSPSALSDSETFTITVRNVAPAVDAGPDRTAVPGEQVTLSGTFTDPGASDTHSARWRIFFYDPYFMPVYAIYDFPAVTPGQPVTLEFTPPHATTYHCTFTVTDDDGGVAADQSILTASGTPQNALDLQAGSDTGASDADNVTNAATLVFDVNFVQPDTEVLLIRDDLTAVASRIGPGPIVDSEAPEGLHLYQLQKLVNSQPGPIIGSQTVTIDRTKPQLTSPPSFSFELAQSIQYSFSEDIAGSMLASDILVQNLTTSQTIPDADKRLSYADSGCEVTLTFINGLSDGDYRATIPAANVADRAGNALSAESIVEFFVMAADANHNGWIDGDDYAMIDNGFNLGLTGFSNGDFDYNGVIDADDYAIIDFAFNTQ